MTTGLGSAPTPDPTHHLTKADVEMLDRALYASMKIVDDGAVMTPSDEARPPTYDVLAFLRGAKLFRDGKPRPACDLRDEVWACQLGQAETEYLGWMLARALVLMKADRVRHYIEEGHDL